VKKTRQKEYRFHVKLFNWSQTASVPCRGADR
jgi:hypothetical protein